MSFLQRTWSSFSAHTPSGFIQPVTQSQDRWCPLWPLGLPEYTWSVYIYIHSVNKSFQNILLKNLYNVFK